MGVIGRIANLVLARQTRIVATRPVVTDEARPAPAHRRPSLLTPNSAPQRGLL
jgi:hypothetical protein